MQEEAIAINLPARNNLAHTCVWKAEPAMLQSVALIQEDLGPALVAAVGSDVGRFYAELWPNSCAVQMPTIGLPCEDWQTVQSQGTCYSC